MNIKLLFIILAGWLLSAFGSPAYAGSCGAANQRPCTIFERIPSCDKGLYEDFRLNKCLRPKPRQLNCGATNQRPCKIWERIPSCNKGLVENFAKNRCERPKPIACGGVNRHVVTL